MAKDPNFLGTMLVSRKYRDESLRQMLGIAPVSLFYTDGNRPGEVAEHYLKKNIQPSEWLMRLGGSMQERHWNDHANRLTLFAAATRYQQVKWLFLMDDDELVEETVDYYLLTALVVKAEELGCTEVTFKLREMWNSPLFYRSDGIWGEKRRTVLLRNPLLNPELKWDKYPFLPLHHYPKTADNKVHHADYQLKHFGMQTYKLRHQRLARYQLADKFNACQPQGYDYLVDEKGMVLTPFKDTI